MTKRRSQLSSGLIGLILGTHIAGQAIGQSWPPPFPNIPDQFGVFIDTLSETDVVVESKNFLDGTEVDFYDIDLVAQWGCRLYGRIAIAYKEQKFHSSSNSIFRDRTKFYFVCVTNRR